MGVSGHMHSHACPCIHAETIHPPTLPLSHLSLMHCSCVMQSCSVRWVKTAGGWQVNCRSRTQVISCSEIIHIGVQAPALHQQLVHNWSHTPPECELRLHTKQTIRSGIHAADNSAVVTGEASTVTVGMQCPHCHLCNQQCNHAAAAASCC